MLRLSIFLFFFPVYYLSAAHSPFHEGGFLRKYKAFLLCNKLKTWTVEGAGETSQEKGAAATVIATHSQPHNALSHRAAQPSSTCTLGRFSFYVDTED